MRDRILEAAKPGGLLSEEKCSLYQSIEEYHIPRQYAHQDHLIAHAVHFRRLMIREQRDLRKKAKDLAVLCAAEWRRKQPPSEEDILRERTRAKDTASALICRGLEEKWGVIRAEIMRRKLAAWQEEQERAGKLALNEMLEHSTQLLHARRVRADSEESTDESLDEKESSKETEESEDESNMSSVDSASEEGTQLDEVDDDALTAEQLRIKYSNIPETQNIDSEHESAVDESEHEVPSISNLADIQLEEVDDVLLDASDESTDMDDETSDEEELEEDSDDDDDGGLLGFFSKDEKVRLRQSQIDEQEYSDQEVQSGEEASDNDELGEEDEVSLIPNASQAPPHLDTLVDTGITSDLKTLEAPSRADDPMDVDINSAPKSPQAPLLMDIDADTNVNSIPNVPEAPLSVDLTLNFESDLKPDSKPEIKSDTKPDSKSNLKPDTIEDVAVTHKVSTPETMPVSLDISSHASPTTTATKPSEIDSASSVEIQRSSCRPSTSATPQPNQKLKTPIPSLLRGTLREYQHYGLDWLAGLYANNTNGILADEMGLGKTIQTIALLAHLACEHEVWGPHLIVVPTSVMLNWEMEFKKWCPGFKIMTYYGTQEERKQKRRGWNDDDLWHVCITSYQLVLQDQQVFKRRAWHYLILDEAHNIKNFRSQRWQTLLTFRTRARLLLTGTPLQNNLTELWSLLFFLMPSDSTDGGIGGFADLKEFSDWFRRPVEQILEHGKDNLDEEAKQLVTKLHQVLRPYLLRRLKKDVEKQMPAKIEHTWFCRLSKRQRALYDGFMALAQTRETLASGNYLSIINCLMQLRKVCNHPDLFETRPIKTSLAMQKSAIADYEIKEFLVRRRLLYDEPMETVSIDFLNLVPARNTDISTMLADRTTRILASGTLQRLCSQQKARMDRGRVPFDVSTIESTLACMESVARMDRFEQLRHCVYLNALRSQKRPIYGRGLLDIITLGLESRPLRPKPNRANRMLDWYPFASSVLKDMIPTLADRALALEPTIQKFACVTPTVVATDLASVALTKRGEQLVRDLNEIDTVDPFHESRIRLSIAFPDKRLLQYDCGKLQRLDVLLRELKAKGSRALIFTQMTKVLDILEQFLNIHGHRYLRLDGATKVEQRQVLTDRFNNDNRILAFILSTRSGGLGINLTGADTVIFYDMDWNPAMDKQCQDRCHRIGQTRDVNIYRFVSEYTIESNILRKAQQKQMLDNVVIQEVEFTTDYFNKLSVRDMLGDDAALLDGDDSTNAAIDRMIGASGNGKDMEKVLEQVEDKEDNVAAKVAQKELRLSDDADFEERPGTESAPAMTPKTAGTDTPMEGVNHLHSHGADVSRTLEGTQAGLASATVMDEEIWEVEDEEEAMAVEDYMLRFMERELIDVPAEVPGEKAKKKKGTEHRRSNRKR
jgi:helicase SWR1